MTPQEKKKSPESTAPWTFLSNHAHVLITLALDSSLRIQDVAERVGITYRAVQRILDELEAEGYLERRRKEGDARSNEYVVSLEKPLRHPVERHRTVAMLVDLGRVPEVSGRAKTKSSPSVTSGVPARRK
jgi:DNA-binding Lrp family transcriptional regulator